LALALPALRDAGRGAEAQRLYRAYADRIATELGIEPSARLRALAAAVSASAVTPGTVPVVSDAFIGRRLELRRIAELLDSATSRAVVLHGPGGVGKSRLAHEVLAAAAPRFADGAHWVPLEDVLEEAQVAARISQSAGLQYRDSADAVATLATALGDRHLLLVLDNAEHLPGLGAQLQRLMERCARLRVLVTSRERPAALDAEPLTLVGLEVPDEESQDEEAAAAFDATQLFVERARFHQPRFRLAEHLDAVNRIVRSVQGLPLAIEMAAAWVRLLPPVEIARELQSSIDVLERDPAAGAPARREHVSVRATLQRSWELLAPKERAVLGALGVFRSGFTREAAQAVAGASLPLLASLVDKSLVQADRDSGRFDLHPLVAAFAAEHGEQGDRAEAVARHAVYFARWIEPIGELIREAPGRFVEALNAELENVRAAWRSAVSRHDAAQLGSMALPLGLYLRDRGRFAEGAALLAEALVLSEAGDGAPAALARVHRMIASLHWQAGRQDSVDAHARKGVRLGKLAGDGATVMSCLCTLGLSLEQRNRSEEARRYYVAALKQAEADGDSHWIAVACNNLGGLALQLGKLDESLAMHRRVLQLREEVGDASGIVQALNNLGNHYRVCRQWVEAAEIMRRGLMLAEKHRHPYHVAYLLVNLGLVEQEQGNGAAAMRCFERVLELEDRGATPWLVVEAKFGLARLAARRADLPAAWDWLTRGMQQVRGVGFEHYQIEAAIVYAEVLGAEGDVQRACGLLDAVAADERADATLRDDAAHVRARWPDEPPPAQPGALLDIGSLFDEMLARRVAR